MPSIVFQPQHFPFRFPPPPGDIEPVGEEGNAGCHECGDYERNIGRRHSGL